MSKHAVASRQSSSRVFANLNGERAFVRPMLGYDRVWEADYRRAAALRHVVSVEVTAILRGDRAA